MPTASNHHTATNTLPQWQLAQAATKTTVCWQNDNKEIRRESYNHCWQIFLTIAFIYN